MSPTGRVMAEVARPATAPVAALSPNTRFLPHPQRTLGARPSSRPATSDGPRALHEPRPYRIAALGQTGSRVHSTFGTQIVKPTSSFGVPYDRQEPSGKLFEHVKSSQTDLVGRMTKHEDIHGNPFQKFRGHTRWPGKTTAGLDSRNWLGRDGYGQRPTYLDERMRTVATEPQGRQLLHLPHNAIPALSESTMRATEHPLAWKRVRRARRIASAASLRSSSSVGILPSSPSSSSLCCTFGLHPAFPRQPPSLEGNKLGRKEDSNAHLAPAPDQPGTANRAMRAVFSAPALNATHTQSDPALPPSRARPSSRSSLSRPASRSTLIWRGPARPYPQDSGFLG
jgi:hypothetical protein